MKMKLFSDEWRGTRSENTFLRLLVPLLILSNLATGIALITQDKETILIPPNITETMSISTKKADVSYKKSWGLFVANLVGNVTPANADFINEQLSQLMDPISYHAMKSALASQIIEIRNSELTVEFEANQILYEPESDKVFILGKSVTAGVNGRLAKESRVFELQVSVKNGRPLVKDLQTYVGEARTSPVLDKLARRAEAEAAKQAAKK